MKRSTIFALAAISALAILMASATPIEAAPRGGRGYGSYYGRGYYGPGNYGRSYYGRGYYGGYYGRGYYGYSPYGYYYGQPYRYYRPKGYGVPAYSSGISTVGYSEAVGGPAVVTVNAPKTAAVWFAGIKATQEGPKHKFRTKHLDPGRKYNYNVKARWTDKNGKTIEKTKTVTLTAGKRKVVNFLN